MQVGYVFVEKAGIKVLLAEARGEFSIFFFLVLGILNFKYYLKKYIYILTRNVFIINTFYSPFSVPYFEKKITMMIKNWLFSQRNW